MEKASQHPNSRISSASGPTAGRRQLQTETASLEALVHHAGSIEHDAPLEQAQGAFAERSVEFLALVRNGMVTGLCSRSRLGVLLGSRFGFALYGRRSAHLAQVHRPLVFTVGTPILEVLDRTLARQGDEFREDVVLVDGAHALVGLLPVDALARLQTQLVGEQLAELQRQQHELLAANQARRQSQGRYDGLFDSHTLGVALMDRGGIVHTHNRRLAELLAVDEGATALTSLLGWLEEPDRSVLASQLELQASGSPPSTCELTLQLPGRGERCFRCSFGWIAETSQICACLDDISEQRAMERQLARQEKQTLLDTLVGGIAHELNNKLTPVQGFAELIGMSGDPQTRQHAAMIAKSVGEAARIIRQLLQLSKPATTVTRAVDLRALVEEALSMLQFQLRESRCQVQTSFPADPMCVQVDPSEIKQVLINLVLNALQATCGRSHPAVDIVVRRQGRTVTIDVEDNGMGIPPENLGRIFDPFFTTKGPERGTGLGLSVCYSLVRQHGGEITVASAPEAGARFTVALPLDLSRVEAPEELLGGVTPELRAAPTGDNVRVLLVEDDPQVSRLVREVLAAKFGCEVDIVSNGIDALERVATSRYALVLSDVRMPAMNGTELYLWLREAQPLTAQRFVFITGFPGESHLQAEKAEWGVPILIKPFTVSQLCEVCRPFLVDPGAVELIA